MRKENGRKNRYIWMEMVNKGNKQKLVTIPKDCDIEGGDEVWIEKVKNGNRKTKNM